jgi:hypothetical protein
MKPKPEKTMSKINPAWVTTTVRALAIKSEFDERLVGMPGSPDKSVRPILADALQDAGCDDEQLLADLRSGKNLGRLEVTLHDLAYTPIEELEHENLTTIADAKILDKDVNPVTMGRV